jgi:hypothetical protein
MITITFLPSSFKAYFGQLVDQMGQNISLQLHRPFQQPKVSKKVSWVARNRLCWFIIFSSSFTLVTYLVNYIFCYGVVFFSSLENNNFLNLDSLLQLWLVILRCVFRMANIHHHVWIPCKDMFTTNWKWMVF